MPCRVAHEYYTGQQCRPIPVSTTTNTRVRQNDQRENEVRRPFARPHQYASLRIPAATASLDNANEYLQYHYAYTAYSTIILNVLES